MDAQALLPVLFRPILSGAESGLSVRVRSQPGGRKATAQCGAKNKGQFKVIMPKTKVSTRS